MKIIILFLFSFSLWAAPTDEKCNEEIHLKEKIIAIGGCFEGYCSVKTMSHSDKIINKRKVISDDAYVGDEVLIKVTVQEPCREDVLYKQYLGRTKITMNKAMTRKDWSTRFERMRLKYGKVK